MKESTPSIFLACDDSYASLLAVTIASICYSTDAHIHFYVLDGGILDFHKKQITSLQKKFTNFGISFVKVDSKKIFEKLYVPTQFTKDTYSRFLIPSLFPEVKKALYLDVDLIALDDIAKLFNQNLHGKIVGAVPAPYIEESKLNLDANHQYFNAGVLLIDCEQWREKDCTATLIKMGEENPNLFDLNDQSILNKFFNNNYLPLDYKFNATTSSFNWFKKNNTQKYNELIESIVIRHYTTVFKPFVVDKLAHEEKIPHFEDFWFFAEMTPFYAGLKQKFLCSILNSTQKEMTNKIAKEVTKESVKEIINIKEVMKEMMRVVIK